MVHKKQVQKNDLEAQPQKEIIAEQGQVVAKNSEQDLDLPASLSLKISKDTYFALSPNQFEGLKSISEAIFKLTNEILLDTIQKENFTGSCSWIESRYGIVKNLWKNGKIGVNLMRIDFAWDHEGNPKILELNTASQGGWIISPLVEEKSLITKTNLPLAPKSMFYIKYLIQKLGLKMAFIVTRVDYNRELDLLLPQIVLLGAEGRIILLSENTVQELINFAPTGLFWKSPSVLVEQAELVCKVVELGLPQIPSFEALFIAGDKAFLTLLRNKDKTGAIPKTYVLSKNDLDKNLNFLVKDKSVLKPGDLFRGERVEFGKNLSVEAWEEKIKEIMNSNEEWVIQELCYLKKNRDGRYEDIMVFLADGVVQGVGSRISKNEVVNVAKDGMVQVVILQEEENELQNKIEFPPKSINLL